MTVQQGASTASDVLTAMAEDCPDGQIAMVGYSKGAMVAHETELSQDVQDRMAAVAVYGDPFERIGSDDGKSSGKYAIVKQSTDDEGCL